MTLAYRGRRTHQSSYRAIPATGSFGGGVEPTWVFAPPNWSADGSRRAIIMTGHPISLFNHPTVGCNPREFAQQGFLICGMNSAYFTTWGNSTVVDRIGDVWQYLKEDWGVATDKFLFFGQSNGFVSACNYTRAFPSHVAAIMGHIPVISVDDIHDNDRLSLQASIESAHGGSAGTWEAAKGDIDPFLTMDELNAAGRPTLIFWARNDTICLPQFTEAFDLAVQNTTLVDQGATDHAYVAQPQIGADFLRTWGA